MGRRVVRTTALAGCGTLLCIVAVGCGEAQRDASEPGGVYTVEVTNVRFPSRQAIAHDTTLELTVTNRGAKSMPNAAVTLDSLSYQSEYPNLAASERPTWIVNRGPGPVASPPVETESVNAYSGADTAFVHTWALGPLAPHATKTFVWHLTPVKSGVHQVRYLVHAGLDGKAKARLSNGQLAVGNLTVAIAPRPPATHVNPETGRVAAGPTPVPVTPQPAAP